MTGILLITDDDTPRVEAEQARDREVSESKRIRDLFTKYVPESVVQDVVGNANWSSSRGTLLQRRSASSLPTSGATPR